MRTRVESGGFGGPATIADGADVALGATTDAESAAGDGTVIALLKRHRTLLGTIIVLLGAGLPVLLLSGKLATDAVTVVATAAAPTYAEGSKNYLSTDLAGSLRTSGGGGGGNPTGGWLDSVRLSKDTILGIRPNMTHIGRVAVDSILGIATAGQKVMASSVPVVIASDQSIVTTSMSSWIGSTAPTVGQKTMAASIPVTIASDQSPLSVSLGVAFAGVYSFSLVDQAGVAAAQNFLCVFNPAASGDTLEVQAVRVHSYSNVAAATRNSIRLTRVTTCTVGTLQAATAINKFLASVADATAQVRTANPTVTAAAEIIAWGANHNITAAGTTAGGSGTDWIPGQRFILLPGEGVVLRQTIAGDVDQTYDLRVEWGERQ